MNSANLRLTDEGSTAKQNWKLVLAYDGTDFHGWQVQPDHSTVQQELGRAIEQITGERVLPQGSGRTDAGVHALGQVASFLLRAPIPAENLLRALNHALPASIRVLSAEPIEASFHARHAAKQKTYEYRIYRGSTCPPFLARYVYDLNQELNVDAMQSAAAIVVGQHDFTSFAAADPDLIHRAASAEPSRRSAVRTIYESTWQLSSASANNAEDLLTYRVRGSGFLHHMVRNLVGTFLEAGRGNIAAADMKNILAARSRAAAGRTAPARGLFLISVDYDD